MADDHIPEENHFAKQCTGIGGNNFSDEDDGYHEPPWLQGKAFQPTQNNPEISGLWVEREPGSWDEQISRVRNELIESKRDMKSTYMLAIIKVEKIKKLGRLYDRGLHVLHTPDEEQGLPSHSEIRGIHPEDGILQQKLADAAITTPIYENS